MPQVEAVAVRLKDWAADFLDRAYLLCQRTSTEIIDAATQPSPSAPRGTVLLCFSPYSLVNLAPGKKAGRLLVLHHDKDWEQVNQLMATTNGNKLKGIEGALNARLGSQRDPSQFRQQSLQS